MKIYLVLLVGLLAAAQVQAQCAKKRPAEKGAENKMSEQKKVDYDRLPDGIKLTDEVRELERDDAGNITGGEIISVEEKLRRLGAKYSDGVLVDADGREIRFYRPPVRGTSQGLEADKRQREQDREELRKLEEKYTVVILYVNPLKVM